MFRAHRTTLPFAALRGWMCVEILCRRMCANYSTSCGQQAQSNVIFNWSIGSANSPYLVRDLAVYS